MIFLPIAAGLILLLAPVPKNGARAIGFVVSIAVLMLMAPGSESRKQAATASVQQAAPAANAVPAATAPPAAVFDPARLETLKSRQTVPMTELSPRH